MMRKSDAIAYIDIQTLFSVLLLLLFIFSSDAKIKANTIDPSQYLIEMTWADGSSDDIDLWVETPNGAILYYRAPNIGGMSLDVDNTGLNSYVLGADGKSVTNLVRREVASVRAAMAGIYTVNVMYFRSNSGQANNVKVHVFGLNPYQEIIEKTVTLNIAGDENTIVQFELDKDGKLVSQSENEQVSLFAKLRQ